MPSAWRSEHGSSLRSTLKATLLAVFVMMAFSSFDHFLMLSTGSSSTVDTNVHQGAVPSDSRTDGEWRLAAQIDDVAAPLRVYTRVRRSELSFRFEATIDASVTEVVSIAREADLMPSWNPFCQAAGVPKAPSTWEHWVYADFKFSPLPMPPIFVVLHATLEDRTASDGHFFMRVASSPASGGPDALDRAALPADMLKHSEMVLTLATGTLTPLTTTREEGSGRWRGAPPRTRTRANAEMTFDLSKLLFMGPLRFVHPPAWLVNVATRVLIPGAWRSVLDAIAKIHADGSKGPIGARIAADRTGLYRRLRRASGQSR